MSVINQMLRDLDQRQSPTPNTASPVIDGGLPSDPSLLQGTVSLGVEETVKEPTLVRRSSVWIWVVLSNAALVLAGGVWLWQTQAPVLPAPPPQAALSEPVVVQAPIVAPVASAVVEPASAPVIVAPEPVPTPVAQPTVEPASAPTRVEPKPVLPKPVKPPLPPPPSPPQKVIPAVNAPPVVDVPTPAQNHQQATKDAMAHAQSLWSSGSHDAAIELMQAVVATTERTVAGVASPLNAQLLSLPVRELTRMQLAVARPAPVLELLTRLEPLLGDQADLWAVRANAAQRLGRHQDSVQAYITALQSRPNEQRWLLGAAVSLAALGKINSAADMAEKARAVGVISKDVLAYLRQLGVPIKEQQ